MATYSTWLGKQTYAETEVAGRVLAQPFNLENNTCLLTCTTGYWANWGTGGHLIDSTDPAWDQRCTSDNCKQFDVAQSAKHCTACWTQTDMATYNLWTGRGSYTEAEIAGR
jgi:hypothetical protein